MSGRFTRATFAFFEGLAADNSREWFDQHRQDHRDHVKEPFADLLEELSARLAGTRLPVRGGPQTMFRINRDVRFSNDKRPYNENVSALLTLDGTKGEHGRLLYLDLGARGGRVGGGMHRPRAADLEPVRRHVVEQPEAFDRVLERLDAADVSFDLEDQLATMPRGFAEHADHARAELLRAKQLVAMRPLPKTCWLDDSVGDRVVEAADALADLYDFIDEAREEG